ncbi:purine-nucleoside phosphorylase [Litoribacter ruber]|uniref:purine-nucleoside phosphorylase n=1 Tax=Litoribacter ruber TaxID=702568 RepID=UPI001BDB322B|nr:purine-nucleoside phosphorylase [Litoribacter ruber]MBT0811447.1 purine-nucleoside phosphorylase [Litoribacter ruber]
MRENFTETLDFLRSKFPTLPKAGIILGSGLGNFSSRIEGPIEIPYSEIPNFPQSTVEGHSGTLIFGTLKNIPVVAMSGRFHFYEGYEMDKVTFPVRVLKLLGIDFLAISNAAGGLNPSFQVGDLMIIQDHIDLFPYNPLRGKNEDDFGVRFPDLSEPFDMALRKKALEIAVKNNILAHSGVYAGVQGPKLETRAEMRYLRIIGADAVGMSTVPEVIVARHMDLPVIAVSAITNLCIPQEKQHFSHDGVVDAAQKAEASLSKLVEELLQS